MVIAARAIRSSPWPPHVTERRRAPPEPKTGVSSVLGNRFVATGLAVSTAAVLALSDAPSKGLASAGLGGLILWPIFGATNQLLGGLALLVVTVWLVLPAMAEAPTWPADQAEDSLVPALLPVGDGLLVATKQWRPEGE